MSTYVLWNCSQAYGMQGFYQQTQEWIQARRNAQQNASRFDQPIMDEDLVTMAVRFERSVLTVNVHQVHVGGFKTQAFLAHRSYLNV